MIIGSQVKLNLVPSGVMPVVYINQGDAGYDKEFLIYNGDSPYNVPSGVSATIRGTKADGYGVTEAATVTTGSNLVTVTITEQMVAAAGKNVYELVFVDANDLRVASINMVWAVKTDALGDAVISDSDLDYATTVMNQLQSVQAFKIQMDKNTSDIENNADDLAAETAARIAADNTLQNNINAEASTRATQDAVLSARMDTFSSLPSGSTSGNAELLDIRVAADGKTYPSAGDAVRGQVDNLKNALDQTDLESTAFIDRHNGMMNLAGTSWMYTTNINYQHIILPVSPGQFFKITQGSNGNSFWAFLKSYDISSAPDLSAETSSRQNNSREMLVPEDANYLYVNVNNNGTITIPDVLTIGDWDFSATAKSQILAGITNVYNCILRNTPMDIINKNKIGASKTSFTSGTVEVGFEEPDIITLGGSYSSGAQRITLNTGTLKANTKYTFFVKNTDGLIPAVGIAYSGGFVTYNDEKVETTNWNSAIIFETGDDALAGVYAYLRANPASLNNKVSIYVVEGEYTTDEFYIYENNTASRLYGKKVAWYGDSIVQGYAWCETINSLFGFDGTNCGSGGSRITYTDIRNDSMCLQNRMQGNYTPTSGVATAIPNDVDVIFVEGGTNDWGNSVSIGDPVWKQNPDNTIFADACHVMFDNLTTLFPNAEIIVIGTPWAKWANHFTDTYGILNNNEKQTVDYGDTLLDVAGRWGIKGINISREIEFNDNNISGLTSDGIHPNATGSAIIANVVAHYLSNL